MRMLCDLLDSCTHAARCIETIREDILIVFDCIWMSSVGELDSSPSPNRQEICKFNDPSLLEYQRSIVISTSVCTYYYRRSDVYIEEEEEVEVEGDAEELCKFCDAIDFAKAGVFINRSGIPDISSKPIDSDEDLYGKRRSVGYFLDNSRRCLFCRKISEAFSEWRLQKFGVESPDFRKCPVYFVMECMPEIHDYENMYDDVGVRSTGGMSKINRIYVMLGISAEFQRHLQSNFKCCTTYGFKLQFQKCSQHPLKVEDFCNGRSLLDWDCGEAEAYSGRIRPLVADTRLFWKWKETCCAFHGEHCASILKMSGSRPCPLRLIDVEKRCIVDVEDDVSYTALSYVWGTNVALPQLKRATIEKFRQVGSLTTEMLPSTIGDAIEVTRGLQEKYLWVDCLCIMQDDVPDKHSSISQMDSIYGFASVTIVAASGDSAHAGLPGIKPNSRTRRQEPFTIKGVSLMRTLDPESKARISGDYNFLEDSVWLMRAWTLQEKIFSRRALIFTAEQVYWECPKATWCEDGIWETREPPIVYRHCFGQQRFHNPWQVKSHVEFTYRMLVESFSERTLTYPGDALDAFGGILHHFERESGQRFLWALPECFLMDALMWLIEEEGTNIEQIKWRYKEELLKRRTDMCVTRASDGTTILCDFPSWSWVGWMGKVCWTSHSWKRNLESSEWRLKFYYLDGNGVLISAQETWYHKKTNNPSQTCLLTHDKRTTVTLEDIPEILRSRSINSNILFFWSSTAKLDVRRGKKDCNQSQIPTIISHKGKEMPFIIRSSRCPLVPLGYDAVDEFVVIGETNKVLFGNRPLNTLFVLLVSPEDSVGVVRRRGLVSIQTSDWLELDNLVWKMICLG